MFSVKVSSEEIDQIKTSDPDLLPSPTGLRIVEEQYQLGCGSTKRGGKIQRSHSVFEKIFAMGTPYFLHHIAVTLSKWEESERAQHLFMVRDS